MSPDDPRHGHYTGYRAHRYADQPACDACKKAAAEYEHRRTVRRYVAKRPLLLPSLGYRRRLQALVALGYPMKALDREMGWRSGRISRFLHDPRPSVNERTAQSIAELYDRFHLTPPPDGANASRARTLARRQKWAPPMAWDDIDHDERPTGWNLCSIKGCQSEAVAKGKCQTHYRRERAKDVDESAVVRALSGDFRAAKGHATRAEVVRKWVASGRSTHELARLSGWKPERYWRINDDEEAA